MVWTQQSEKRLRRWQQYTELNRKGLHDPDNHSSETAHLEPDILKCEVKWAFGSTATREASAGDEVQAELLQILNAVDDAVKELHSICQQIWKTQQLATGLEKVSFHSNPKEGQCQRRFKLPQNGAHLIC